MCALLTAHGGGPCFQDPGTECSACLFPGGGSCIAGGARKVVVLPGLTGLGAVGACLSGSLPGTTARRLLWHLPSSGRGSCVCALGCIVSSLHQGCPREGAIWPLSLRSSSHQCTMHRLLFLLFTHVFTGGLCVPDLLSATRSSRSYLRNLCYRRK